MFGLKKITIKKNLFRFIKNSKPNFNYTVTK